MPYQLRNRTRVANTEPTPSNAASIYGKEKVVLGIQTEMVDKHSTVQPSSCPKGDKMFGPRRLYSQDILREYCIGKRGDEAWYYSRYDSQGRRRGLFRDGGSRTDGQFSMSRDQGNL
jgi:hypothetical protein